ncbi:MAG TPA: hypothetical protein PKL06_07040 [Chitinophagales bacterium]|nr:hypothetical protein [Chitinophagales bacterium]
MEIFEYIFYIGVINIVFSSGWKLLATVISSLLKDIGINKDATFLVFKTVGYYILVSLIALVTVSHMEATYKMAAMAYAIVGTFVIYATIASNLERNRWRAVMNYERKRVQVMRYDGYLLMACIVLFIITLLQPGIAQLQPLLWLLHTIDTIFQTPLLKWVIGFFAFIYMLSIIFRGIKFSDEVFALITNRKKPNLADAQENQGYTDYEEITDDDSQLPK